MAPINYPTPCYIRKLQLPTRTSKTMLFNFYLATAHENSIMEIKDDIVTNPWVWFYRQFCHKANPASIRITLKASNRRLGNLSCRHLTILYRSLDVQPVNGTWPAFLWQQCLVGSRIPRRLAKTKHLWSLLQGLAI